MRTTKSCFRLTLEQAKVFFVFVLVTIAPDYVLGTVDFLLKTFLDQ